jgi:benzoyl-CoA reductase subunit D
MITAGIDVGVGYVKAVIVEDGKVIGQSTDISGGTKRAEHVHKAWTAALEEAKVLEKDIEKIGATGKGKHAVSFASDLVMESIAAVKAARFFSPASTTVVSVGADETLVSTIREDGSIGEYTLNQKCAAGIGILLEALGHRIEMGVEEMGDLKGTHALVNDGCPVFAELDALSLLNAEVPPAEVVLAVTDAMAVRANTTINDITVPDLSSLILFGGMAKNKAFVKALEKRSGLSFVIPEAPEYASAVGAALYLAGAAV